MDGSNGSPAGAGGDDAERDVRTIKLAKAAGEPCLSRCRDQGNVKSGVECRQRMLRPRKVESFKVRVDAPRVAQASSEVKA